MVISGAEPAIMSVGIHLGLNILGVSRVVGVRAVYSASKRENNKRTTLQLNYDAHARTIGLVPDVRYAGDFSFVNQVCYLNH
jgi:hypothetical protein